MKLIKMRKNWPEGRVEIKEERARNMGKKVDVE